MRVLKGNLVRWFIALLKNVGTIAGKTLPSVVGQVNPPVGALLGMILNGVLTAEAELGPGKGAEKQARVLSVLQIAALPVLQMTEAVSGRDIADDEQFAEGIRQISDGIVKLLNSMRVLPKGGAA